VVPTGWLPRERLVAERATTAATPVPLRLTDLRPPHALVTMLRVAMCVPVALGVKVTLTVQLALGANEPPQVPE
jgi:hypothetical protein